MKIICIGQNYLEHIQELSSKVPTEPVFFMKPDTALMKAAVGSGSKQEGSSTDRKLPLPTAAVFYLPDFSNNVHYEAELVIRVCKEGKNVAEEFASRYYDQITVGIDITARDLQQRGKEKGLPWEPAKSFDNSAPVGELMPFEELKNKKEIIFELKINGATVQQGNSAQMIFSNEKIISYVTRFVTIRQGDLIFTGTPKGVGALKAGDLLEAFLEGRKVLQLVIK
jgi:acylpyruvate hydrolase